MKTLNELYLQLATLKTQQNARQAWNVSNQTEEDIIQHLAESLRLNDDIQEMSDAIYLARNS